LVRENSYFGIARQAFLGNGIWVGHRIVGAFWLFKALLQIYGANVVAFLANNFILHSLNVVLFYFIVQKIKKTPIAVVTAFVLGSFYLTWISNIHEILAATFVLLSTLFWIRSLEGEGRTKALSIGFYILAILTKEITFVLPLPLGLLALYKKQQSKHNLDFASICRRLTPFLVIFLIYLFTYASDFLGYKDLPSQDSYKIGINPASIAGNILFYGVYLFPVVKVSLLALPGLFLVFILFDLVNKKLLVTPFLISFFIFLGPALLFEKRGAYYYVYIATFFLFIGLTLLLEKIYASAAAFLKNKPRIWMKIFTVYFVLILLLGIFKLDKLFLDNCFLVQYPWENNNKQIVLRLVGKIEEQIKQGTLKKGSEIVLSRDELTPETELVYESNSLPMFMRNNEGKGLKLSFDKGREILLVEEFPQP
jgi:hypothetical protein